MDDAGFPAAYMVVAMHEQLAIERKRVLLLRAALSWVMRSYVPRT